MKLTGLFFMVVAVLALFVRPRQAAPSMLNGVKKGFNVVNKAAVLVSAVDTVRNWVKGNPENTKDAKMCKCDPKIKSVPQKHDPKIKSVPQKHKTVSAKS